MSFKKFCPKCGKETNQLIDSLCVDCFLKGKEIFNVDKVSVLMCKHCKKIFSGNKEISFSEEIIAEIVASKIKIIPELEKPKIFVELQKRTELDYEALIKVKGFLGNQLIEKEKIVQFRIKETTCDSCMKLNADYREAILQLRASNQKDALAMFQLANNLLDKDRSKDSLAGTSKVIELKNGFDLWVGSKKAAAKVSRYLSKLYKVKIITSKKLIGEEDSGERKYRHTFCIKIK